MHEEPIEPGPEVLSVPSINRPAKYADAAVLMVVFIGAQLVLGVLIGIGLSLVSIEVNNAVFIALELATFAITMLVMQRRLRSHFGSYIPTRRAKLPVYLSAVIGGIGLLSLLQPIEEVLMNLVPMPRFLESGFILGLLIGLLFIRTGSILPGLLVHGLYNGALIGASRALQTKMNGIGNGGAVTAVGL